MKNARDKATFNVILFGVVMKRRAVALAFILALFVAAFCTPSIGLAVAGVKAFEVTTTITWENYGGYYGLAYDSAKSAVFITNVDFDEVSVISDGNNSVVANIAVGS